MLFCSYIFILAFLPLTLLGYFSLNRINVAAGRCWLLAASFFFYGYFNYSYLLLLLGSLVFNYAVGRVLERCHRRWVLIFGCVCNLLLLGYFKYYDFFVENINALFGTDLVVHKLLLPLGISFFTFQQISYLSDVYNGVLGKRYSPLDYALFVSFFPQLIAGPIVLANEMMPQFARKENLRLNYGNFSCGIFIFALGLAKKILIADNLAPIADRAFALAAPGFADSAIGSLAYVMQIYFDFSGYSDMAIGLGAMFNIMLPELSVTLPFREHSGILAHMAHHLGAFPGTIRLPSPRRQQEGAFPYRSEHYGDLRTLRIVARRQLDDGLVRSHAGHGDHDPPDLEQRPETPDAEVDRRDPDLRFLLDVAHCFPRRKSRRGLPDVPGTRRFFPESLFADLGEFGQNFHNRAGGLAGDRFPSASGKFIP